MYRLALVTIVAAASLAIGITNAGAATTSNSARPQPSIQHVTGNGPAIAADHPWTINYWDAHDHLTRVWHGTKARADILSARWRSTHAAHRPAVSPAIVHTSGCSEPTSYWVFWHWKMECFAHNGSMAIYITGIYQVDSGNNYGYYRFSGSGTNHYVNSYTSDFYNNVRTVVFINILRRCKYC